MAKNKVEIDVKVDDKGTTKKVALGAKKAGEGIDKTAKSAGTLDRNMKGAAQATSNGTKEFSKMSQGMGGLVGVYATIAAQVFAVSAAFQFLKSAAEVTNLIRGQEAMGAVTGVAYKSITKSLKEATNGQLQYAEAAKAAAIGTAAGLSPQQLERLAVAAKNTSLALGRDLTDSFNRLVRGVTKAEPELLDELGIILRLKDATDEYAAQVGKNVNELTQFEKSQAIANNVLEQAETKFGKIALIMNEDAVALSTFLASFDELINSIKVGVTKTLTPLFKFLSDNTLALSASLALFALPILKTILPSFDAMSDRFDETIGKQESRLKDLSKSYEKTTDDIRAMGASKDEALGMTEKSGAAVYKGIGLDPKKMRSKKGVGAADFLTGGATSAAAQANAKKVLANAEAQIKKHGKVTTGHLKGASAKQVANLRKAYNRKAGILKKYEVKHRGIWNRATMHIKKYATQGTMYLTKLQKVGTKVSKGLAKGMNLAFKVAGFIGLATLIYDLGRSLYEFLYPIPDNVKKAQEAIEAFTESTALFNEELSKMVEVRADTTLQSLQERVSSLGNAFTSADLASRFKEFMLLEKGTDAFDKAQTTFQSTIDQLSILSPAFKELADSLDLEDINIDTKNSMIGLSASFSQSGVDASKLTDSLKTVRNELTSLAGTGKAIDPTINLRAALGIATTGQAATIASMRTDLAQQRAAQAAPVQQDSTYQALVAEEQAVRDKFSALPQYKQNKELKATREQILEIQARQVKREEDLTAQKGATAKQIEKNAKELAAMEDSQRYLVGLSKAYEKISGDVTKRQELITDNQLLQAKNQTVGITFAQKEANLTNDRLATSTKLLQLEQTKTLAAAQYAAATAKNSGATAEQVASATAANDAALGAYDVGVETARLADEKNDISQTNLDIQKALLDAKQRELVIDMELKRLADEKNRSAGGLTGSFGLGRAAEQSGIELETLQTKLSRAEEAKRNADEALRKLQQSTTPVSEGDMTSGQNAVLSTGQDVVNAQTALDILKERANEVVRSVQAENELLRARMANVSLNPAEQAFNDAVLAAKQKGIQLDQEQLRLLKEQSKAQTLLEAQLESMESIRDSIQSGLEGAFTSLIDGTKGFKQAFGDMAKSILGEIAKMIAKQMALKALMAFGFADGGVVPGGVAYANGGKVPGGFRAFANGGVVRQPTLGLIGEGKYDEAVVPLPDGRSIPVQMQGGTSQQNNVVVNVSVDSKGNANSNTQQSSGPDAEKIGTMVATAVQKELQEQKRSGGILNPYGAS